ncbi:LLM class F420-dependent oxidoreductase [Streptomyces sp. NPDC102279]|uniref:LLM class F420-dependent oxidoreductase n=1 Tax=Streptomyces sp. NPDC102279 TaxID=3366153 RepID=UPI00381F4B2A
MNLGVGLSIALNAASYIDEVVAYEAAGADTVWVGEGYGFDAVSTMGALAHATERVHIGSGILGLYNRTPTTTAMSMAGVDALSDGRAILGLGASGPQVVEGWHGVPYTAPIGRTREVVEICRAVWRRDRVEYAGRHYQLPLPVERGTGLGKPLKLIHQPVRDRIPVFLAALGEKNVALTAEIAEGWLPIFYWPERATEVFGPALARGLKRRDPELGPLQTVATGPLAIGEGTEEALDQQRHNAARYFGGMGARGHNFYNNLLCAYGYPEEAALLQDLYLDGRRQEAAMAVPEELLRSTSLIGTSEEILLRLAAYRAAGVTHLTVIPQGATAEARVGHIARLRALIDQPATGTRSSHGTTQPVR